MSDGPRDAARWEQARLPLAVTGETVVGKVGQALHPITKGDMARILDRYAAIPVGELKDEELHMILRFKATLGD